MTQAIRDDEALYFSGNIAVDSEVRGRNHFTGEIVSGTVTSLTRSGLDNKVYAVVTKNGSESFIMASDLTPDRIRCRRPILVDAHDGKTYYVPQGTGYRCGNCGKTIWFYRGRDAWKDTVTHDAVLAARRSF